MICSEEHVDLVMDANRTALYNSDTDATASFERLCHSRLGQPLSAPADRAQPHVLEGCPAAPEPPPVQVPEVYATEDDVASVLAVANADVHLWVEVLCRYQGNLRVRRRPAAHQSWH